MEHAVPIVCQRATLMDEWISVTQTLGNTDYRTNTQYFLEGQPKQLKRYNVQGTVQESECLQYRSHFLHFLLDFACVRAPWRVARATPGAWYSIYFQAPRPKVESAKAQGSRRVGHRTTWRQTPRPAARCGETPQARPLVAVDASCPLPLHTGAAILLTATRTARTARWRAYPYACA